MENEKLIRENLELRLIAEKIYNLDKLSRYLYYASLPPDIPNKGTESESVEDSSSFIAYKNSGIFQKSNSFDNIGSIPTISPVEGWITKSFLYDTSLMNNGHQGIDFAATEGTPIKSTAPGVVRDISNDKYFGLLVTVQHENGFVTRYGHCSQVLVSVHDRVKRGQTIALVGNTGRSSAPHLHYEVIKDGRYVNPLKHIIAHKE
jgi:murein DD-endopeptidase MepM/ murein hydrolase activator NlpD